MGTIESRLEALERRLTKPKAVCIHLCDDEDALDELEAAITEFAAKYGQPPRAIVRVIFVPTDGDGRRRSAANARIAD